MVFDAWGSRQTVDKTDLEPTYAFISNTTVVWMKEQFIGLAAPAAHGQADCSLSRIPNLMDGSSAFALDVTAPIWLKLQPQ